MGTRHFLCLFDDPEIRFRPADVGDMRLRLSLEKELGEHLQRFGLR